MLVAGIFYDQDRVLARKRDQQDEADLRVKIIRETERDKSAGRAKQGKRYAKDNRKRQSELSYWPASTR